MKELDSLSFLRQATERLESTKELLDERYGHKTAERILAAALILNRAVPDRVPRSVVELDFSSNDLQAMLLKVLLKSELLLQSNIRSGLVQEFGPGESKQLIAASIIMSDLLMEAMYCTKLNEFGGMCGRAMTRQGNQFVCSNGHSFPV